MSRIFNVARMQWNNRATFITIPLLVMGGSLTISLLIFWIIPVDGAKFSGGGQAALWYFFAVGIQSLTLTFPFSLAMSVTRREFFFGSMLAALGIAFLISVLFVAGGLIERATNGWWIDGWMFYLPWIWAQGLLVAWLLFMAMPMAFFTIGFCVATIYKRFGAIVLTSTLIILGVILVGLLALIGRFEAWAMVGAWIQSLTVLGLAGCLLLVSLLLSALSLMLLQRATA